MIDSIQIVIFAVIIALTVLLVVLGIQVFFILKEVRRTLAKTNKVLEDAACITESVSRPISTFSNMAMTFNKAGSLVTVAKIAKNLLSRDEENVQTKNHKS